MYSETEVEKLEEKTKKEIEDLSTRISELENVFYFFQNITEIKKTIKELEQENKVLKKENLNLKNDNKFDYIICVNTFDSMQQRIALKNQIQNGDFLLNNQGKFFLACRMNYHKDQKKDHYQIKNSEFIVVNSKYISILAKI